MKEDSTPVWSWQELAEATSGRWHRLDAATEAGFTDVIGAAIDSRTLRGGELFIALPGDLSDRFHVSSTSTRDGHDFVSSALEARAAAALVSQPTDLPIAQLIVEDTVDGLWALARAARNRLAADVDVVAVTGSSGKTTAKTMLHAAMGGYATAGSLNNHLGVPLSLTNAPPGVDSTVFEIGTSSPGEIGLLTRLVMPDVAIVLNVHPAHIANFANLNELRAEKLSIADGLQDDGLLVLLDELAEFCRHKNVITFGDSSTADVRLLGVDGDTASYATPQGQFAAKVPGGGHHRALTLGAVLACLLGLGRDLQSAADLADNCVPQGRGDAREIGGITVIDDSYNANPASMRAALEAFSQRPAQRRFVLLGEMLELGEDAGRHHGALGERLSGFHGVWLVGEGFETLKVLPNERGRSTSAGDEMLTWICSELRPGDALLIKGSNRVFWANGFAEKLRRAIADTWL